MNLEEYLAKIIKLATKTEDELKIRLNNTTIEICASGSKGCDWYYWHLCKSLDEQPEKEGLKSLFKGFKN